MLDSLVQSHLLFLVTRGKGKRPVKPVDLKIMELSNNLIVSSFVAGQVF